MCHLLLLVLCVAIMALGFSLMFVYLDGHNFSSSKNNKECYFEGPVHLYI